MSYDDWKTTDTNLEYSVAIENLIDDEIRESESLIDSAYDGTFGSIKFDDLTISQIDKYLSQGINIFYDNEYLCFDDFEELSDNENNMYILFLLGFNNLVVGLCDVDISLFIKCTCLNDNDVAQELDLIIEQRKNNI